MSIECRDCASSFNRAWCLLTLMATLVAPVAGEERKITQTAGVENVRTGPYRALAQLSFQAFQKGDLAMAAELARILERTWDAAEGKGGEQSLIKTDKALFENLDRAMDVFIKPILAYATKTPDPAAVEAAYKDFKEGLKRAD